MKKWTRMWMSLYGFNLLVSYKMETSKYESLLRTLDYEEIADNKKLEELKKDGDQEERLEIIRMAQIRANKRKSFGVKKQQLLERQNKLEKLFEELDNDKGFTDKYERQLAYNLAKVNYHNELKDIWVQYH